MKIVISLSGSFVSDNLENSKLKEYVEVLKELDDKTEKLVVVCGAGSRKDYIEATKGFEVSEGKRDMIGIQATRLHANLLNALLGERAYPDVPESIEEVEKYSDSGEIITMGGTEPGHSTDAVAALAGEIIGADLFINATKVDGIYDKDPKAHEDAEKLEKISYRDLIELISEKENDAGCYSLIDHTAAKIIERADLKTVVINGSDPQNILKASKEESSGTIIE